MDSIKTRRPRRTQGKRHGRVRTPTVLQMEAVECGAAALGIILGYYGRHVPLAELRRECGVSRDGSNAANVLAAARRYGLMATGYTMEVEALEALPCPVMIFWNFDHFVVVEGFRRGRVYLNDPASGPRSVSREEFGQSFTGVVLVMAPGPDFTPGGQPPSTLHALRTRLRGAGGALAYCVLAGFFLVLPGLAVPVLTQVFVDQILIAGLHDWLRPLLLGLLLTAVCRGALLHLQLQALRRLKRKLAAVLSSQFLWHLLHLPSSFYAQRYAGEISQRLHLNDQVADVLSGRLATTVIDGLMMLVYAGLMLQYDVGLTGIGLGCAAGAGGGLAVDGPAPGGCHHAGVTGDGQAGRARDGRFAEHGNLESRGRRVGFLCPLGRVLYQGEQCPADVARDQPAARRPPHLLSTPWRPCSCSCSAGSGSSRDT